MFHFGLVGLLLTVASPLAAQMPPLTPDTVVADTSDRIEARTADRARLATELADVIRLKNLLPPEAADLPYYERRERELVARIAALDSAGVSRKKPKRAVSEGEVLGMIAGAVLGLFIASEINK